MIVSDNDAYGPLVCPTWMEKDCRVCWNLCKNPNVVVEIEGELCHSECYSRHLLKHPENDRERHRCSLCRQGY